MLKRILLPIISTISIMLPLSLSYASNTTLERSQEISHNLALLQSADFIKPIDSLVTDTNNLNLQPRHLFMKARQNHLYLAMLLKINGLSSLPNISFPSNQWQLSDIDSLLEIQKNAINEIKTYYDVDDVKKEEADNRPQTLTDAIYKINHQLFSFGIPAQNPGIAYQYTELIINILNLIAVTKNIDIQTITIDEQKNKRIHDAYLSTLSTAAELQYFATEFAKVEIPGGVLAPEPETEAAEIEHLINALEFFIADIVAIKNKLGVTGEIALPEFHNDKTPSDVYNNMTRAFEIIFSLEDSFAE